MKKTLRAGLVMTAVLILAGFGGPARAHDEKEMAQASKPSLPEFEMVKKLAGTWTGMTKMGGKDMEVVVTYEVTAGGSAVVERLFKGTPHEMLTVYYANERGLALTHYCMLGNHPSMSLKSGTDKSLAFEMRGAWGLSSVNEPHMHAMTLTWLGADQIRSEWVSWADGKEKEKHSFDLKRKA